MSLIVILLSLLVLVWHSRKRPRFEPVPDISYEIERLRNEGRAILDLRHINQPNFQLEHGLNCLKYIVNVDTEFVFQPLTLQQQQWLNCGKLVGVASPENSHWGLLGLDPASASQLINSSVGNVLKAIAFPPAKKRHRKTEATTKPTEVEGIRLRGQVLTVFLPKNILGRNWGNLLKTAKS